MKKFLVLLLVLSPFPSFGLENIKCKEPLPEFTLGENSNPSKKEVRKLCACIWSKFTKDWERETSAKIRAGQDPGWRGKALVSRFGSAMKKCGGYEL